MQDDTKMPRCWNYNQVGISEKIDSQQQQIRSLRVGLALSLLAVTALGHQLSSSLLDRARGSLIFLIWIREVFFLK